MADSVKLFWDDGGTVYLSTTYRKLQRTPVDPPIKDFAIHICTVVLSTGRCTSQPVLIRESSSGVAEGSHILKRGKYYYLFTAEGGTESGHCEWVLGLRKALSDLGNSVLTIHCGGTGQKTRCRIRGMLILWLMRVEIGGMCFWGSGR